MHWEGGIVITRIDQSKVLPIICQRGAWQPSETSNKERKGNGGGSPAASLHSNSQNGPGNF